MANSDPYSGREQTEAKHFILKRYLQALAFKVLHRWDVTYVDGFSGPWESRKDDLSDTSFMIAIQVLKDAQRQIHATTGNLRRVRCFFSEVNPRACDLRDAAVLPYNKPEEAFEVVTHCGRFEDAVSEIRKTIGTAFPLIFIDPTGWTGYPFDKIRPIFDYPRCEVLINFMYDFVNRFAGSEDEKTRASLNPILGGPGWEERLDQSLSRGLAIEKLFRESLRATGNFAFVISTRIEKSTIDRPHFCIAYATKDRRGLITFRQTEYEALRRHTQKRTAAKQRLGEERSRILDMFAGQDDQSHEKAMEQLVEAEKSAASAQLLRELATFASLTFAQVVEILLQRYILRETNVKDICIELAAAGKIERTWGGGNRKPQDSDRIKVRMDSK